MRSWLLLMACVTTLVVSACSSDDQAGRVDLAVAQQAATVKGLPPWARPSIGDDKYDASRKPKFAEVAGYGDPDSSTNKNSLRHIQIRWTNEYIKSGEVVRLKDESVVELALVMPYEPEACGSRDRTAEAKARQALKRLLPIGSRVLIVPEGSYSEDAFLHVLAGDRTVPKPLPPAGSVNERLVATGTWVPRDYYFYFDDRPYSVDDVDISSSFQASKPITTYDPRKVRFADSKHTVAYGRRILQAANKAIVGTVSGWRCAQAYNAYVEAEIEDEKKRDADRKASDREWERRQSGGYCRDGDGDGICNER